MRSGCLSAGTRNHVKPWPLFGWCWRTLGAVPTVLRVMAQLAASAKMSSRSIQVHQACATSSDHTGLCRRVNACALCVTRVRVRMPLHCCRQLSVMLRVLCNMRCRIGLRNGLPWPYLFGLSRLSRLPCLQGFLCRAAISNNKEPWFHSTLHIMLLIYQTVLMQA